MFTDLIKTESHNIRGRDFTFYEISALDWVEYLVVDEVSDDVESTKSLIARNRDFSVRVIATSLAPGVSRSIGELIEDMEPLSNDFINELFDSADNVNGITKHLEAMKGKVPPATDMPDG